MLNKFGKLSLFAWLIVKKGYYYFDKREKSYGREIKKQRL